MLKTTVSRLGLLSILILNTYASLLHAKKDPGNLYHAPLLNQKVVKLTDSILRVTVTLNPNLPAYKVYNIAIFATPKNLMVNCEVYGEYNGCYFTDVTTSSTLTFLLLGHYENGYKTIENAIIGIFSIPSPEEQRASPYATVAEFQQITFPKTGAATIEYYPFSRLPD